MRCFLVGLLLACAACSPADSPNAPRLPASGDPWATRAVDTPELREGAAVYTFCASCHLADGGGRPDGDIPRLAGQPKGILEQKLNRIRSGETFLPVMAAFANALTPEEVPAVAAYMAALPAPKYVGTGDGKALERGRTVYAESCAACHGAAAEGLEALAAPRLCGQHAGYTIRRVNEVIAGRRADANPGMAAVAGALAQGDVAAVADYLSRGDCAPPPAQGGNTK